MQRFIWDRSIRVDMKPEELSTIEHLRLIGTIADGIDFENMDLKEVINIRLDLLEVAEDLKYDIRRMKNRRYIERKRLYKVETIEKV